MNPCVFTPEELEETRARRRAHNREMKRISDRAKGVRPRESIPVMTPEERRQAQRQAERRWRARNPDRVRERDRRYRQRRRRRERRLRKRRLYSQSWRMQHPTYFVERRQRLGATPRKPKVSKPELAQIFPLFPHLRHGARVAFWDEELAMDIEQERFLAVLEGRDPDEAAKRYRAAEMAFSRLTMPLDGID